MRRGPLNGNRLRQVGLLAGVALLAAGAVSLARAQNAPPSSAGATVADAPSPSPPPSPVISSSSIAVTPVGSQSLAQLDLFSAGRETGLGPDLWKGSSADVARMVIPSLRDADLSPAAAALGRDLLATASIAPDGAGNDAPLAAARASAVLALGDAEGASDILAHTPGVTGSSALSEVAAEAALITGRNDKACAIGDALSTDRDGIYWLRLRAFCQALAGKTDLAQLTFTLANQQAHDPYYARLMGAFLAGGGDAGPASLRDGLDFALSVQLKLDLGPALPTASRAIAQQLAATPASAPPPLAGGETSATPPPPPPPPPTEADVLAGTHAATTFTDYAAAAKAARPGIAQLVELKTPLSTPVAAATAAVVASDFADADAIRSGLTVDGPDALDVAILDATLAAARGRVDADLIDRLIRLSETSDSHERGRAEAAAAMVAALGAPASPSARARMANFTLQTGQAPAGRTLAMAAAAEAGLKGETALLALWVAAADGEAGPSLEDRIRIERDLVRVGLAANAQAFAVEGLAQLQAR